MPELITTIIIDVATIQAPALIIDAYEKYDALRASIATQEEVAALKGVPYHGEGEANA